MYSNLEESDPALTAALIHQMPCMSESKSVNRGQNFVCVLVYACACGHVQFSFYTVKQRLK